MPNIFDNISPERQLVKALNKDLRITEKAAFCVGYFNLRGWKAIDEEINKWQAQADSPCKVLVGMQRSPKSKLKAFFNEEKHRIDNKKQIQLQQQLAFEFAEQLTTGMPTNKDEAGLRRLTKQLKDKVVQVKLHLRYPLHAKLYLLFFKPEKGLSIKGYLGSSNLTFSGLSGQGELNVEVTDASATQKLASWFNDRWQDRWCVDISDALVEVIENSWAGEKLIKPYYLYLKIAYHLSKEARAGLEGFNIPKVFRNYLLDFQEKAVLIAAQHLHKRGGVMIGDVVGLGKTITATALAKLFQDDFDLSTLILCPKNLVNMWEEYVHDYKLTTTRVMSITSVQKKLPKLRRYQLLIIDESHNLRNREGSRYKAIQEYIKLNTSKVILLSATPYNKDFSDLSNQLRLFIPEEQDLGISPETYIKSIGGKAAFATKHTQIPARSLGAFEQSSFVEDWRELMRLYLVRRTRSFIKNNYAQYDSRNARKYLQFSNGKRSYFTTRKAKKVVYDFNAQDKDDQYAKLYAEQVVEAINDLSLPRYGLKSYLKKLPSVAATAEEIKIQSNLSRAGKRLMGFCRTNLFKRLESSGQAFLLSVSRHLLRNYIFIHALTNKLPIPIGSQEAQWLDSFSFSGEADVETVAKEQDENNSSFLLTQEAYLQKAAQLYQLLSTKYKKRFQWIRSNFFTRTLKKNLKKDCQSLLDIMKLGKDWEQAKDRQLNALYQLITATHKEEKILIFTQYADTATYLWKALQCRGVESLAVVTGATENPTAYAHRFSPKSNKQLHYKDTEKELRILIATDVLSEGQNLQDAHIILNYDLPWAIIRLIQRAGRVDRIGQESPSILCYSFFPEDGVDKIINLRNRLKKRLAENAQTVGSDEVFFEGDTVNIDDLYTEKSGILEEEGEDEVDLASYAYQIWKNATDAKPSLKKIISHIPHVSYSTKQATPKQPTGVLLYSQTASGNDLLTWVNEAGEIVTQSQLSILKAANCSFTTPPLQKSEQHHDLVAQGMQQIKAMELNISGQLGRKSSIKYKVYHRLKTCEEQQKNSLFADEYKELKKVLTDLYQYPLKTAAKEKLGRQLRAKIPTEELVKLVLKLWEQNELSIIYQPTSTQTQAQIICSLGLV